MPTCVHMLTRGPSKGQPCNNNSDQDLCYLHRNIKEEPQKFQCSFENCDKFTTSYTKRCPNHHMKGIELANFKIYNNIPLSEFDKISKISEFLKQNNNKIDSIYNLLFS